MKTVPATVSLIGFVAIALSAGCRSAPAADTPSATQHELPPLQLIQRIPVPNVTGRIDHFTAYPKRRLLIFAALGNNSMEIVNTFEGKVVQSIKGLNEPQGVVYVPEFDKIFVANAGNGMVNVYDGKTYALLFARVSRWERNPIRITFGGMRLLNGFTLASWAVSP